MELDAFPSASARETVAFCWDQIGPQRRPLAPSWAVFGVAVVTTALVIARRLSTIARMDRTIVLDQGRIVEEGTHGDLLAPEGDGPYRRLWQHQSGGFLVD